MTDGKENTGKPVAVDESLHGICETISKKLDAMTSNPTWKKFEPVVVTILGSLLLLALFAGGKIIYDTIKGGKVRWLKR